VPESVWRGAEILSLARIRSSHRLARIEMLYRLANSAIIMMMMTIKIRREFLGSSSRIGISPMAMM
jgi:hypothetical protein